MDQAAIEAAAQEIADNYAKTDHMQSALTKMWVDHDHDTALMEAAFEVYKTKYGYGPRS
jgi:hypothetical protein